MSTTTTINGWTIPELSDVPNIETAIHPLANAIDARVIPIFTTTGARDSAISSPSFGQYAAVSGTGEVYWYNGSAWVSAVPRVKYKTANEAVTANTTNQADNDFFISVEANSLYFVEVHAVVTGHSSGDFKSAWTGPSGTTGFRWRDVLQSGAAADSDNKSQIDTIAGGSATVGVLGTGATNTYFHETLTVDTAGTSGNLAFEWSQGTSNATATTVLAGSVMRVWKIG